MPSGRHGYRGKQRLGENMSEKGHRPLMRRAVGGLTMGLMLAAASVASWVTQDITLAALGVSALLIMGVWRAAGWWQRRLVRTPMAPTSKEPPAPPQPVEPARQSPRLKPRPEYKPDDPAFLAQQMLDQGRYALLLRPQIATTLQQGVLRQAVDALDESMSIVPEGDVLLQSWRDDRDSDDTDSTRDRLVHVEAIYLDRYPVTNREFQEFVDDGGYTNMPLWDAKIWPAVLDFVDGTGHCGPRFWCEGRFPEGFEDHPAVGVSWYEASAYARWVGKRLPSDPEWVKAGCWPVLAQGTRPMQRRYPWGDTMDRSKANIWGTGPEQTCSVYGIDQGVSVGGVYHLIGNTWEWTTSDFGVWDTTARKLDSPVPLKSIRGGAFDTYFETQMTCQFQSGENLVRRKHNIGFRCALALRDVISTAIDEDLPEQTAEPVLVGSGVEEELE